MSETNQSEPVTAQEVYDLAMAIYNHHQAMRGPYDPAKPFDSKSYFAKQDEFEAHIEALEARAGEGLQVGRVLAFPMGDGNARYMVMEIKPRTVVVAHLALGDAWHDRNVVSDKGTLKREVAEKNIQRQDGMKRLFGNAKLKRGWP